MNASERDAIGRANAAFLARVPGTEPETFEGELKQYGAYMFRAGVEFATQKTKAPPPSTLDEALIQNVSDEFRESHIAPHLAEKFAGAHAAIARLNAGTRQRTDLLREERQRSIKRIETFVKVAALAASFAVAIAASLAVVILLITKWCQ